MSKRFFGIVGLLAVIASLVMFLVGNNSSNLSELKSYWLVPLPVALLCFLAASKKPSRK